MVTEGALDILAKRIPFGAISTAAGATVTDRTGMASTITGAGFGSDNTATGAAPSQMGPGMPPMPFPLGSDPRLNQYRVGWNLPSLPGEGRVSYQVLHDIASTEWLTRKAIEVRKNQIHNIKLDIVARDRKNRQRSREIMNDNKENIKAAKDFFVKPDGRNYFHDWMSAILEDHLVYDAVAIEKRRNFDPEAGPKHPTEDFHIGQLTGLELVDGRTMKRLIDDSGRIPLPPLPFVQQYLYGVPRSSFSTQEFIYAPKNVRNETPYGFSPVEQFLWLTFIVLRYWSWVGAKYSDGTLPEGVAEAPPNWTTAQIAELNHYWDDLLSGDPKALRKLQFVPGGFKWHQFKDAMFDWRFSQLLIEMTSIAFDVTTTEMGFASFGGKNVQIGGGKSAGETQEDLANRRGPLPLMQWLIDRILNPILWEEFGGDELEWVMAEDLTVSEDRAKALDLSLKGGTVSYDEVIEENGGEPIGLGRFFDLGTTMRLGLKDMQTIQEKGWAGLQAEVANALPKPQAGNPNGKPGQMQQGVLGAAQPHSISGSGSASNPNVEPEQATNAARRLQHGGGFTSTTSKDENGDTHHVIGIGKTADLFVSEEDEMLKEELRNYEKKALKSVKSGKKAAVKFTSTVIPASLLADLSGSLELAKSVEDVRDTFTKGVRFTAAVKIARAVNMEIAKRENGAEPIATSR
jgi:hypothetical protein